jgi:hypothetical protein
MGCCASGCKLKNKGCASSKTATSLKTTIMAEADRLDREMLLVMRQAIAAALVREAA